MDQSGNVHLRWNKHQTTLVSVFDALLGTEKLTDCTISAEGRHLKAHKIILSACSPYFETLLTENGEKHPIIILHNVKYDTVKVLMDFMYRGEVSVSQEELSSVIKVSESLQIRGLSGSGWIDDVNTQKGSGSNALSVPEDIPRSEPASVPCFTAGLNEPKEKVQPFRRHSPSLFSVGEDSIPKSSRKYREIINHSGSDWRTGESRFQVDIPPDLDSVHRLSSERQVLPTLRDSTGRPVNSTNLGKSVCRELQSCSGETAVAGNVEFLTPEAVLSGKRSTNLSSQQQEVSLETKSEVLERHTEIVEDLTLDDDDDYCGGDGYRGDSNSSKDYIVEVEGFRASEGRRCEENIRFLEITRPHSPFANDYLNNFTSTSSEAVFGNRFSCPSCGKSYGYMAGLQRHMNYGCGKAPQFQCPRCNKLCSRSDNLKQHMATRRCLMQKKKAIFEGDV